MNKIPVTLFIGEKNFVEKAGKKAKTGYKRHYEGEFFQQLQSEVDFRLRKLYPWKGSSYSALRHFINHFVHVFKYRQEFEEDRVKHIMFAEEAFMLNYLPTQKTVVSCLDVIPLVVPGETSNKYKWFINWAYKGMKKATAIIANSEYTKRDLVKHLKIEEEKIAVAYPPINEKFKPIKEVPLSFYKKYGLSRDKKYLLFVGALDLPRKNVKTVMKVYKQLAKTQRNLELLLVGYTTLKGQIATEMDNGVNIICDVPDNDLVYFYNAATVFLFPTLYEGFGLPPLEAMACETPVVASNAASLPEVLGDGALLIDPLNVQEIAAKTELLLNDSFVAEKLAMKGLKQVKKYTWHAYTEATLKVYKKIWG